MARKISVDALYFKRGDAIEDESSKDKLIVIKQHEGEVIKREVSVDFFGDLKENYEKYNQDYIRGDRS